MNAWPCDLFGFRLVNEGIVLNAKREGKQVRSWIYGGFRKFL